MPPEPEVVTEKSTPSSVTQESHPEAVPEKTMTEVAQEAYDASVETAPDSLVPKEDKTEEKAEVAPEETTPETEQDPPDPAEEDADTKLPFAKHPRWQEVQKQRREFEQKATQFETEVKAMKPKAERFDFHNDFCQKNGIADTDVATVMNALALRAIDPTRAREALKPLWESLAAVDPTVLPAEYKQQVADGEMSEAVANRLWAAECKLKQGNHVAQSSAQRQAAAAQKAVDSSVGAWDQAKRGSDPDFKPKAKPDAPDGLWELTSDKFSALLIQELAKGTQNTPQLNTALLEQAYKASKATWASRIPRPPATRLLPLSSRSSTLKQPEPESIDDVVSAVARKHGISWDGRRNGDDE